MSEAATEISEDVIAEVRAANPGVELHLLGNEYGQAIFRVPPAAVHDRFIEQASDPTTRVQAIRALVFGSLVYPTKEQFQELVRARPGLVAVFGGELVEIAGTKRVSVNRKL